MPSERQSEGAVQSPTPSRIGAEDGRVSTRYVPVAELTRWTFENDVIRRWTEGWLSGRVLNACAGKCVLNHDGERVRNDINEERNAELHVDVAELAAEFPPESFDTIVYDPPWSHYQSNLRYDGHHVHKDGTDIDTRSLPFDLDGEKEQIGHARLAKEGFDYLLKPGGVVLQLTFHGTNMPGRMGYDREERVVFDPIGEAKSVIGSVDRKVQRQLRADGGEPRTSGDEHPRTEWRERECPHCHEWHEVSVVVSPGWERVVYCPRTGVAG